jgi:NAD(P)-dependent dehydrogenase (short-subunit alcohol dehydrogenase family)
MDELLKGKVAIVTGASRKLGIGRACALVLARMGANVVVTGTGGQPPGGFSKDESKVGWRGADSVAEEIKALGRGALALRVDVSDATAVQDMVDQTLRQFGRVDILVSNAAAPREDFDVVDLPGDVWDGIIAVNLTGTYLCCKAVGKQLIAQGQGGRLIVMCSSAGKHGAPRRAAYCASKFGQLGLVQSMAYEVARHNITVNAVCPGGVDTSRTAYGNLLRSQVSGRPFDEIASDNLRTVPLGRLGTPEEIAYTVGFLASPYADYITGQAVMVTGGSSMS